MLLQACCRKLYNWLKVAPYQAEQQMEDDYDFDDNESGVRVLGIAFVAERYNYTYTLILNLDTQSNLSLMSHSSDT